MPASNTPTILVKKSDGTYARMTLSEAKGMKKIPPPQPAPAISPPSPSLPPPAPAVPPPPPLSPAPLSRPIPPAPAAQAPRGGRARGIGDSRPKALMVEKEEPAAVYQEPSPPATAAPFSVYAHPRIAEEKINQSPPLQARVTGLRARVTGEDFQSPLEEEAPKTDLTLPKVSQPRASQSEEIIKKLSFSVPANFYNRLRSVIQLYLKEVRTAEQTEETARRPLKAGGLGLTAEQAEELLRMCEPRAAGGGLKKEIRAPTLESLAGQDGADERQAGGERETQRLAGAAMAVPAPAPVSAQGTVRPLMRDVLAAPVNIGPVEEIRYFTLTDFRRLAANPTEAASRLRQKFFNLKEESFLLFQEALNAWHSGPLFADYMEAAYGALCRRQALAEALRDKQGIQMEEINAIIKMERELNF